MYRLEPLESTADAIRRLACGELDGALEWLGGADRQLDVRIHETRKHLKRLRALLQLAAAAIEPAALREEMSAARAAAASLAELRGQAALLVCFEDLVQRNPGELAGDSLELSRGVLGARAEETMHLGDPAQVSAGSDSAIAQASAILTRARARAHRLPLATDVNGWNALAPGFRATYRRAWRAYARALARPSPERLHAFRTPQKRHLYQVELLERLWEGPLRSQRQELSRLGELLGDHHDLALLQRELEGRAELAAASGALQTMLHKRLEKLERAALSLGALAFAEKPAAITRRFGAYFRAPRE